MPETRRLSSAEVDYFHELIHDRSGLDFPPSRLPDLEQVIAQTLTSEGLPDLPSLIALLADEVRGGPVLQGMIAALTVGETYFFRNQPQFHALEHHILPELIARRRKSRHLRIWSAGCASGEEPYSLAILLERLLPDLADWHIHLLATDINPDVLDKARLGRYGEWSFRHVPVEIKAGYFAPHGLELEIHRRLRERVTFARLNLAEDEFPSFFTQTSAMDLILCRNVLIYFRPETVRRIVARFSQALADDSWLIVGHAEPSQVTFGHLTARNFPGTVVYQKQAAESEVATFPAAPDFLTDRAGPVRRGARLSSLAEASKKISARPESLAPRSNAPHAEASPYQQARLLADRRDWEQAEKWIAVALEREPLSAPAHYLRGLILLERAQPEAALTALRNCVFADADFVLGHVALADLLLRQGQTERARKALETAGKLAAGLPPHALIPEGDGLTAGRLLEMVKQRKQR